MWSERLEKLEHLLVGASGTPGEVMDDDVLQMEIAHFHLVRVAMRRPKGLRNRPYADTWK